LTNQELKSFTESSKSLFALKNEIQAEKQLESDNLGGAKAPTIPGFTVEIRDAEVRLTKTHGNEKILVVFNVSHSVDMDEFDEEQEQETPVPVALPPFSIEITKGANRLCFNMELVRSMDDEGQYDFRVEEFYIAPAAKGEDESVDDSVYASSGKYIDPHLHELLFLKYLEERGFNAKFCEQLVNFATHYEHSEYVSLLTRIKDFVAAQ
uniref:Complement component 1 Q subcomponent-binding protein, mitochondrial n=1 Tax=Syphacia muris TaxID=451379 RepID=A0A0N5AYL0_9BILA